MENSAVNALRKLLLNAGEELFWLSLILAVISHASLPVSRSCIMLL